MVFLLREVRERRRNRSLLGRKRNEAVAVMSQTYRAFRKQTLTARLYFIL